MKYLPYDASLELFAHLRKAMSGLGYSPEVHPVLQCITGLLYLHQQACVMEDAEREPIIAGLVQAICPLNANGLFEMVLLPTLQQKALVSEAIELSRLVNDLRSKMAELAANPVDAQVSDVKQQLQDRFGDNDDIQHAFDDIVLDSLCNEASNINNQGMDHQIKALLGVGFTVQNIVDSIDQKI